MRINTLSTFVGFLISAVVILTPQFHCDGLRVLAQQTVTSASLSGRVVDAAGAIVSGALVTATNLETNQKRSANSDAEGRYRFGYLPVGTYRVTVESQGFTPLDRQITLTLGQTIDMPLKLNVKGVSERVNIISDAPIIETVRTQVTETIRPTDISSLPLNGRNYLDLALLVPGVSQTNTGSNQRFAETSAVPGQGLSVLGQRNLNNSFIVDGLSANDDAADLTGTYFSQEVVREFQVISSGGIAEFGRASSGIINIVTQSGTNDWHGGVYGFFRNQRLDARNPLAPRKDLLTQGQYGATIGGPINHDRTFFFTNFEQTRRNYSAVITIAPSAVSAINSGLNAIGYRGPRVETGVVPAGFDTTNLFARVDHRLNRRNQLTAHYSLYDITADNSRNVGGLNAVSRGTALSDRDSTIAINNDTTVSSRTLNEARFQFTRSRLEAPVNDAVGPAVNISGVANFGTATFSPLARDIDLYELVDSVSTQRGTHSVKGGVDFLQNRVNILFPGAVQGVYTFSPSGTQPNQVSALTIFWRGDTAAFSRLLGHRHNHNRTQTSASLFRMSGGPAPTLQSTLVCVTTRSFCPIRFSRIQIILHHASDSPTRPVIARLLSAPALAFTSIVFHYGQRRTPFNATAQSIWSFSSRQHSLARLSSPTLLLYSRRRCQRNPTSLVSIRISKVVTVNRLISRLSVNFRGTHRSR